MKILMVLAHPDDEVVFGWPLVQTGLTSGTELSLLTLSDNRGKRGDGPVNALAEICAANRIHLIDVERVDSNFYRTPPRYSKPVLSSVINLFQDSVKEAIAEVCPDFIFTHNPMGEYGHGDHRFVFNIVSMFSIPLMMTDICFTNPCHLSSKEIPDIYRKRFYNYADGQYYLLDMDWYTRMRIIYEKHKAWSWSGHDPVKECNMFAF